jgi:lipopolysaccharide/colanic/teichoic acid biosynthesis glycosyltransferase
VGAATRRPSPWLLITSGSERELLEQELDRRHPWLPPHTQVVTGEQVERLLDGDLDDTMVAISEQAEIHDSLLERLLALRSRGVRICSLVDWAEHELQRVPPELLSDRWLLHADGFSIQPGRLRWRIKRLGDVIGALGLIVLTAPLMLLGALMIRLEDGGPVLYSQIRTGLYGQPIRIWKLRSMRRNAEAGGVRWAARADPRITRSGSILRRLRIDELPQLFGVLAGDLSLIGPRPERPEIELDLELQIPHYRIRHWIRPGLSGWAQVNYPYGASVEDSRMKLSFDLYYVRNSGLLLDLLITLKTIRLVLHARGAQPTV